MEAQLVKSDLWPYVNGNHLRPEAGDTESQIATDAWTKNDGKARSEIILSISSSELKIIKGCTTSNEMWLKLKSVYQPKGPARKATLLRRLTTLKMQSRSDIREHLRNFFNTVDEINEIGVQIDEDLLSTMLMISLSNEFDNFRCAIESRDALPSLEALRVKITEEADARQNNATRSTSNGMYAERGSAKNAEENKGGYIELLWRFRFQMSQMQEIWTQSG